MSCKSSEIFLLFKSFGRILRLIYQLIVPELGRGAQSSEYQLCINRKEYIV